MVGSPVADDPRRAMIDLYLPICSATDAHPITVGHLGQSLDGFIATHAGESQFVTGEENILHLHRMRALCDAVVVGAGTVAADDPQLTTRHVSGAEPAARRARSRRGGWPNTTRCSTTTSAERFTSARIAGRAPGETHVGRAAIVAVDERGRRRRRPASAARCCARAAAIGSSSKAAASPCRCFWKRTCSTGCTLRSRRC